MDSNESDEACIRRPLSISAGGLKTVRVGLLLFIAHLVFALIIYTGPAMAQDSSCPSQGADSYADSGCDPVRRRANKFAGLERYTTEGRALASRWLKASSSQKIGIARLLKTWHARSIAYEYGTENFPAPGSTEYAMLIDERNDGVRPRLHYVQFAAQSAQMGCRSAVEDFLEASKIANGQVKGPEDIADDPPTMALLASAVSKRKACVSH